MFQVGEPVSLPARKHPAHIHFKEAVLKTGEGYHTGPQTTDTVLIRNAFVNRCSTRKPVVPLVEELSELLGRGRAKRMFEGDLDEGELGNRAGGRIDQEIKPAADIVTEIWQECSRLMHQPID